MVSQKNQATDSFFSLQISQIQLIVMYVGMLSKKPFLSMTSF